MNDWLKIIIPILLLSILAWVGTLYNNVDTISHVQSKGETYIKQITDMDIDIDKMNKEIHIIQIKISNLELIQNLLIKKAEKDNPILIENIN